METYALGLGNGMQSIQLSSVTQAPEKSDFGKERVRDAGNVLPFPTTPFFANDSELKE